MSVKDWFLDYMSEYPSRTHETVYYVEPAPMWSQTETTVYRDRPFYYCSKPSTKRWKKCVQIIRTGLKK